MRSASLRQHNVSQLAQCHREAIGIADIIAEPEATKSLMLSGARVRSDWAAGAFIVTDLNGHLCGHRRVHTT